IMARKSRKNTSANQMQNDIEYNRTALYLRLSKEDNGKEDCDSIENQQAYIESKLGEYVGINVVKVYADNGFSGTNFERNAWKELLDDIRKKEINCIVIKDFSRLGRNFVETGNLVESVLPFLGVRLISLNDDYDSLTDMFSRKMLENSFKNLMNECYARDISQKVKTGLRARMQAGLIISAKNPYGYIISDDRTHLIIDEETAPIVRKIFEWYISGKKTFEIIKILNQLAIPSPGKLRSMKNEKYQRYSDSAWDYKNIRKIIANKVYTGCLIQGMTKVKEMGKAGCIATDESEWIITENAHEAIISTEMYKKANPTATQPKRENIRTNTPLLSKVVCGKCGYRMRRITRRKELYWQCASHRAKLYESCKCNIKHKILMDMVKSNLHIQISETVDLHALSENIRNSKEFKDEISRYKNRISELTLELNKISYKLGDIYEDLKSGIISKEEFEYINKTYKAEHKNIQTEISEITAKNKKADGIKSLNNKLEKFISELKEKIEDDFFIDSLIDKVIVYPDKSIEIEYKFKNTFSDITDFVSERRCL
ncbi:MAG: recombinase family protein, partial [Firmicutes bacterium]|nr:recombinase family protein [Bacillota bacterium]